MKVLLCVLVAGTLLCVHAKPAQYRLGHLNVAEESGGELTQCHGLSCPRGTIACSKSTKTSADKRTLLTTVQCEDSHGNVLNSDTRSSENPNPDTQITSFSFTGHYSFSNGGGSSGVIRRPSTGIDNTFYNNNEVETFA